MKNKAKTVITVPYESTTNMEFSLTCMLKSNLITYLFIRESKWKYGFFPFFLKTLNSGEFEEKYKNEKKGKNGWKEKIEEKLK